MAVQTAIVLRHWPRFVAWAQRRYGDVFTLRIASVGTVVYLADPAAIKTVFAGDPAVFHAGEANAMLAGLVGNSSVLLLDDDLHRDRRRLMMAPFARDAVARQSAVMAEIAAAHRAHGTTRATTRPCSKTQQAQRQSLPWSSLWA